MLEIQPLASICCFTYNQEDYIRNTIESFLIQKTSFPFEIIIHDDASTDGTGIILKEYSDKYPELITLIIQTENQFSKNQAGNLGRFVWPSVHGKYVAICEGDDFWTDPYKLQKQVDFLEAHEEYGLVHTDIEYVDEYSNRVTPPGFYQEMQSRIINGYIFDYYLTHPGFIMTLSCMFRKCLINIEDFDNWFIFDHWLFMEIARKSMIHFIPEKTCAYRINPDGTVISNNNFILSRSPYVRLDQIFRFYNDNYTTAPYYVDNPAVENQIVLCLTRLIPAFLGGNLKDPDKLKYILGKKRIFLIKIPALAISILVRKIFFSKKKQNIEPVT